MRFFFWGFAHSQRSAEGFLSGDLKARSGLRIVPIWRYEQRDSYSAYPEMNTIREKARRRVDERRDE
jgi:hypothetical protein